MATSTRSAEARALAKLQIDRIKASADAQAKLLKANADFNYRMAQVLEKRMKVEQDAVRLSAMQAAYRQYQRALRDSLARRRELEREQQRIERQLANLAGLAAGEHLPPAQVPSVWTGLNYFLRNLPTDEAFEIAGLSVPPAARLATNFSENRRPERPCDAAPDDVQYVGQLIAWLAARNYMPRVGSDAWQLLAQVVGRIDRHWDRLLKDAEKQLRAVETDLRQLRQSSWKTIKVESKQPRK